MIKLSDLFAPRFQLWRQEKEIARLHEELQKLQRQNDSMREGMRRCVTCDYRIDYQQRQDALAGLEPSADILHTPTQH